VALCEDIAIEGMNEIKIVKHTLKLNNDEDE
jgi:hypothetical protein